MPIAILSDIHSNMEALEVVMRDAKGQGADRFYCLGDMVGYGPNPAEVVDWAMEWDLIVMGNHDEAVLKEAYGFNPVARAAVKWTREQIKPKLFSGAARKRRWKFLEALRLTQKDDRSLYVHGSPRDPTMEYILRSDCWSVRGEVPDKLQDIFGRFEGLCFCGHTHDPGIITQEAKFLPQKELPAEISFEKGKKYIVNVGSVGQPRDGDPRAGYLLYDPEANGGAGKVRYRRLEYELRTTQQKIYDISDLDRRGGDRLALGK